MGICHLQCPEIIFKKAGNIRVHALRVLAHA